MDEDESVTDEDEDEDEDDWDVCEARSMVVFEVIVVLLPSRMIANTGQNFSMKCGLVMDLPDVVKFRDRLLAIELPALVEASDSVDVRVELEPEIPEMVLGIIELPVRVWTTPEAVF